MSPAPLLAVLAAVAAGATGGSASDEADLKAVHRIKGEAFRGSRVMDHLFHLTDVNGPRLSGSPGFRSAADWAAERLKGWGASSARVESWGAFGRPWTLKRFGAHLVKPGYAPLPGIPKAWSLGTAGPVRAEVVHVPLFEKWEDDDRDDTAKILARIDRYAQAQQGRLKGKIVMIEPVRDLPSGTEARSERLDTAKLTELAEAPEPFEPPAFEWPITRLPDDPKKRGQLLESLPMEVSDDRWERLNQAWGRLSAFLAAEGVAGVLTADKRGGAEGIVFAEEVGPWRAGDPVPPSTVVLPSEHYGRLARLVERKVPVEVELDVQVDFPEAAAEGLNVIAEIPGGRKRDEVVMLGAHLDSWHSGTGATDNAAGCAVVLEAFRVLKALGLPMDRTVRLALWGGEEQGYFGSKAYVREHFADPATMALKPEHGRLAAYFNLDNGTGKVRGVYLQGNDMVRPTFEAWLTPFRDLGASTVTIRDTGGTDHLSFDAVGLPGFQFIQDPLDYGSRTHHSNLDVYDHVQPADLMQASAIVASFVYHAAMRAEPLPRKPLPKAPPPKRQGS
jgi:carboxypeptidase Q